MYPIQDTGALYPIRDGCAVQDTGALYRIRARCTPYETGALYPIQDTVMELQLAGIISASALVVAAVIYLVVRRVRVGAAALDCAAAALDTYAAAASACDWCCSVDWDLCARSRAPIPVAAGRTCTVESAPNEFKRRAIAWFYRHNDAPDAGDWRDFLYGAGMPTSAVPTHTLLSDSLGPAPDVRITIDIDLERSRRTIVRQLDDGTTAPPVEGAIVLGTLTVRTLFHDAR